MRKTFGRLLAALMMAAVSGSAAAQYTKGTVTSLKIVNANDVGGVLRVEVGYEFPGPQAPCHAVDFHRDGQYVGRYGNLSASGTFETTIGATCSNGYWPNGSEHTITATPVTGGLFCLPYETRVFGDPVPKTFTVQSPTIESAEINLNSTGGGVVTVGANFQFTNDSFSSDERSIQIFIDGVLRAGGEFHPRKGTQNFPFDLGCAVAPGAHAVGIIARRCYIQYPNDPGMIDTLTTSFSTPAKQGTVTVTHEKDPNNGEIRLLGTYTLPPNTPSAQLVVQELTAFDESGNYVPTGTLRNESVQGPGGTFEIKPFTPATGALQVRIKATLSACSWQADAMTAFLCGECTKPPIATKNPVGFSDGNMRYSDADPLPRQLDAVALTRTYDTHHQFRSFFGRGWWSLFDARLIVHSAPGGDTIAMTTETNEAAGFLRRGGVYTQLWPAGQQVPDVLTFDGSYYALRRAGSNVASLYRGIDGRFAGLRQIGSGREMRVEWSAGGMPVSVTDSWTGLTWTLTTDAAKRRITDIAIGDLVWRYEYDANDNLQRVLAPGSVTWRTYTYVNDRMTEARDASGNLIESHTYNAAGAAIDSTGPDDEIESIQYLAGTAPNEKIARLTMKTGAIAEYVLQPIGNAYRTVRITGGCSSCGARDASYAYDAEGHLVREQDASGYITVHTYAAGRQTAVEEHLRPQGCDPATDPNRCRLDPASLATATLEATTATLRTSYEYADPIWPDKPTAVTTASVLVPGGSRVTTTVYHPLSGQVLRTNVSGWTGDAAKTDRGSSTIFYGDPPPNDDSDSPLYDPYAPAFDPGGTFQSAWLALPQPPLLPKLIDGPRIDAEDITLFVYYPVSEAVPSEMRGRLAAVKNAAGNMTRYESYDLFGNVTRVVDPNGVATEMEYDILGRLETATIKGVAGCDTTKDPLCATDLTSTRSYSPLAGPLESETRPGGGVTKYNYDERGRVRTLSRGPSATDLRERIEYSYDTATANKSGEVISAFEGGTWVEKTRESFGYDTLGQLITVTRAEVDGQPATAGYEYDPEGLMSKMRDENQTVPNTLYTYDPADRVAAVTQTLATASGGVITTRYGYDVHGNMTSVTDPNGNVTTYQYDDFGNLITQQSPVTGTTFYHYDDAGNLIDTADARGARTTRAYDALGRVITTESTLDGVTETVSWTYDDTTTGTFGIGRLAKMSDPAGTTDYRYERRGLLREEHRAFMTPPSS
ncbi:MAG TPA: DUF6531 domain-containing protein, partial [Thermoanaerobaculia bacterium]|nr:DUF6531 domain-containing protein [Thermoanaerobaculia bacterium]